MSGSHEGLTSGREDRNKNKMEIPVHVRDIIGGLTKRRSNWGIMTWSKAVSILVLMAGSAAAQSISLPGALTVPSLTPTGVSFTYSGTLTQSATLSLNTSGSVCLQSGAYCTNAAGVVLVPGTLGVGGVSTFSGTFGGTTNNWNQGAIGMTISGVGTVQIFPANAANGAGSGAPPNALSLPSTSLSSLGFGPFSAVNPTITFFLLDDLYPDNSGSFTLTQSIPTTPVPSTLILSLTGLAALAIFVFARRRVRSLSA